MKDVARVAGVSLGTVSNVLNNHPTVSEENRTKVINAVQKLNYRPNTAARTLKTKISKSIGLVIPDITNPFFPELARGVEDAAKKAGLTVFLCNNDRNIDKEREYIDVLISKNVDGIILVKPKIDTSEIDAIYKKSNLVLVDFTDTKPEYDIVNVDDHNGTLSAMNLLYEFGHRRIAFIQGIKDSQNSQSSKYRYESYAQFLSSKGSFLDEDLVKKGNYDWYSGYTATVELLRQINTPTAIFSTNDLMAIGAMKAIEERRLKVPFDISVMGYDDIDMASLCTPKLTTIRQPKYEMGIAAVNMLVNRLNKSKEDIQGKGNHIILKTEVVLRESVGYAREITGK